MIPPLLFEAINGLLFPLGTCALAILVYALAAEVYSHGWSRLRLRANLAWGTVVLGEFVIRCGWTWATRRMANTGHDVRWITESTLVFTPVLGAAVAAIGLLCVIRVFQPDAWGRYAWQICGVGSITFMVVSTFAFR